MPLYKITHADETRLVKAASAASALRHVTTPMFQVTAITDPSDAAEIAASGVKLETAGEVAEGAAPAATPEAAAEHEAPAEGAPGSARKHAARDAA